MSSIRSLIDREWNLWEVFVLVPILILLSPLLICVGFISLLLIWLFSNLLP